jgi:hypothetical protein
MRNQVVSWSGQQDLNLRQPTDITQEGSDKWGWLLGKTQPKLRCGSDSGAPPARSRAAPGTPRRSLRRPSVVATSWVRPLNSSTCPRVASAPSRFGRTRWSIHHGVDSFFARPSRPPRREGPRNRPHRDRGCRPPSRRRGPRSGGADPSCYHQWTEIGDRHGQGSDARE